jgi:hypothetical protein
MHDLPSRELPPLLIKPFDPEQLVQLLELELSGGLPELKPSDHPAHRSM